MRILRRLGFGLALALGLAGLAQAQQAAPYVPAEPFKTVHLMVVAPAEEPALRAAVHDYNRVFADQGCATCAYHLYRMFIGAADKYNFMMISDWPDRQTYLRIHDSAAFKAASARNEIMSLISQTERYGRYVEVK